MTAFWKFIDYYWDLLLTWGMHAGMPLVHLYHALTASAFLNVAADDATGLEKVGNTILIPAHYLLAGKIASQDPTFSLENTEEHLYRIEQRFDYKSPAIVWAKTAFSVAAFPISIGLGSAIKGISYLSADTRKRHERIAYSMKAPLIRNLKNDYKKMGIELLSLEERDWAPAPQHLRRPGDEKNMTIEKEALREVAKLLTAEDIAFWLDCGTCLGSHRYGGIIPWDFDIDIAVLQPDFDNVYRALQKLDPEKYLIQDWSSRDRPKSYLKVYVKQTGTLIDIYHFAIHPEKRTISSILSNENSIFLSNGWKTRERRFIMDTPYEYVFPLKKVYFDGILAFVPNQTEKYLQQRYGENIGPAKVFNPATNRYEKDENHPYWKQPFAH